MDIADRATLPREDRSFTVDLVDLREGDNGWKTFEGVASTVEKAYSVRDQFGEYQETIGRGAFARSIEQRDNVDLLYNHNRDFLLANVKSKSLTLRETPDLSVRASLNPADPDVQKVAVKMEDGRLNEMSIGFRVLQQEWNDDYTDRRITEARLFDVSVVNTGMSPFTEASLRSLTETVESFTEADEDEVRRAIAHLTALLPVEEIIEPGITVLDAYRQLWDSRGPAAGIPA